MAPNKVILPPTWKVPETFRSRLGESAGRQRAMTADGHLLIVLHELPRAGVAERQGRFFWREPDGNWKSNSLGVGIQALKKHVAEYAERIDRLEEQLQEADNSDDYFRVLHPVTPLCRASRNMHATLQQAREMLPADHDLIVLRDQAGEIERAAELLEIDARHGLEFMIARKTEEQAQRGYEMAVSAHRLNLLAAIFFPIATLSAIFGMNLNHGLSPHSPATFWTVLVVGLVSGTLLTIVIANRPRSVEGRPKTKPSSLRNMP